MKYFSIALCVFMCACASKDFGTENNQEAIQYLHFVRNKKTGLCFAIARANYQSAIMTNVPCTPEVEKELDK